eukprot:1179085-Prorocentrum_minimum.AAC.1
MLYTSCRVSTAHLVASSGEVAQHSPGPGIGPEEHPRAAEQSTRPHVITKRFIDPYESRKRSANLLARLPINVIFSLALCEWCPLRVYSLSPSVIGARYEYILSPLLCLMPAKRVYSLSTSVIDARYEYILSPLLRLVPAT